MAVPLTFLGLPPFYRPVPRNPLKALWCMLRAEEVSREFMSALFRSRRTRLRWRRAAGFIALISIASSASLAQTGVDADGAEASQAVPIEEPVDWELVGLSALDAVILRPLGAVTTVGGFVFFLASVPFVAPSGHIGTAWDVFVYGPYDDTFVRPLGEI